MLDSVSYSTLALTRQGRALTVTINRPSTLNGVNSELHEELGQVLTEVGDDPHSDVVVLTGAGRAFCAGGDFQWLREKLANPPPFAPQARTARRIVFGILDCPKPIIARVNGDAYGLGASIALLCDIIIAVDTARFADTHVQAGLSAGDGGALIWPQLLGFAKAKQYLLTGEPIGALEALRLGMINFAVPAAELDAVVDKYVQTLLQGAQLAIRYTKTTVNIALRDLFNSVFETSLAYEGLTLQTNDHIEGVKAFLEKRKPKFTGT
jgi:enoyl-CoA hydratase